ncbi:MAG: hypothetical protein IJ867_00865 [Clostridia bacterium]|nr:hypothetical protein [Clostridia bacterium]
MAVSGELRLKIRHFIQDHYRAIIIVLTVFIVLVLINRFLVNKKYTEAPQTTYSPNVAILDTTSTEKSVPTKVANEFETFIKDYIGYCNNRNYVGAWNMVSSDCKKNFYGNSYDLFVTYVQQKFNGGTKRYAIQNYSNVDGMYIYNVKIFDDFLATGLTNQRFAFQEEKFTISYDDKKNLVCSVGNYIDSSKISYMASNDYLRIELTDLIEKYNFQMYKFNFINRTNYTIVIKDGLSGDWEVGLAVKGEIRSTTSEESIVLAPGESKQIYLSFEKFYDSSTKPSGIILNSVRVMENYTGNPETAEAEIENAIDKFSMTIAF